MPPTAKHPIPPMTDPLSQCWNQPSREAILVDDHHALMAQSDFETLPEYSISVPSGVYEGKMWRRHQVDGWFLCWYGPGPDRDHCAIHFRPILLLEKGGA